MPKIINNSDQSYERELRSPGIADHGESLFDPEKWGRAFAMVVARDKVAAVWGAQDPGGTIYLYAEHALPHAEPSENARAIRAREVWIPGLIHIAGSTERFRVAYLYQQLGLQVQCCGSVEEAALFQFWHLLATNQLKIFASLSMFLEEYRIGEEQSPSSLCPIVGIATRPHGVQTTRVRRR